MRRFSIATASRAKCAELLQVTLIQRRADLPGCTWAISLTKVWAAVTNFRTFGRCARHAIRARRTSRPSVRPPYGCWLRCDGQDVMNNGRSSTGFEANSEATDAARSANMRSVRSRDTAPERTVRSLLHHMGYRFRLHRKDLPGTPDIVLPRFRTAIFVHGCFWHGHDSCPRARRPRRNAAYWHAKLDRNRERDARQVAALQTLSWRVFIAWECMLKDEDGFQGAVRSFLSRQNAPL